MIPTQLKSTIFPYTTLFRSKRQKGEPPQNLPVAKGMSTEQKQEIVWMGRTEFKNQEVIFGIKKEDRFKHMRSEEHTSELQSHSDLVCRLLLEKKKKKKKQKK